MILAIVRAFSADARQSLLAAAGLGVKHSSLPVSDQWYRIEVSPNGNVQIGEKVNLAITYTPSGLEEMEYLLINGSYNNYFWPGSDDENFVTITMVN